MADSATPSWVVQISLASCSTQPGLGKYWVNSFCATLHMWPCLSNRMQRLEVVPASSAIMYCPIAVLLFLGIFAKPRNLYKNIVAYHPETATKCPAHPGKIYESHKGKRRFLDILRKTKRPHPVKGAAEKIIQFSSCGSPRRCGSGCTGGTRERIPAFCAASP